MKNKWQTKERKNKNPEERNSNQKNLNKLPYIKH